MRRAILSTLFRVGSRASGRAVEGLMPMQMRGLTPRVPRMYLYSVYVLGTNSHFAASYSPLGCNALWSWVSKRMSPSPRISMVGMCCILSLFLYFCPRSSMI